MANYNSKIQGFIEGLSDFWLLYFKEIDQLALLYQGTEFLIGQSYLDMLSLLLNNSLQDCPLFNKELFKLLQIRETDIAFLQKGTTSSDRYVYVLPDNLVNVRALHNKILSVTSSLDRDVDYEVNSDNRTLEFKFDPLNAYIQRTFGADDSEFILRTKQPSIQDFKVQLSDTGTVPVAFSLNSAGTDLTITYDGPANTSTTQARDIVSIINTHPIYSGLLVAELTTTNGGLASPQGTAMLPLLRVPVNPLLSYASRAINVGFGGKLATSKVTNWPILGVQKGDIIRLLAGPGIAEPRELPVSLVRADALYTSPDTVLDTYKTTDALEFVILREPYNNQSVDEPFPFTGATTQTGIDGVINAAARTFSSITANFSPLHLGELVEINGFLNNGYARILQVLSTTTVELSSTNFVDESGITWGLLTTLSPSVLLTNGVIVQNVDGTTSFTSASNPFIASVPVVGTVIKVYRAGLVEKYLVTKRLSDTEVLLDTTTATPGSGLTWGWARYIPSALTVAWDFIVPGSVTVTGRRAVDEQALVEGIDYVVYPDLAQIKPLTVWRTDVNLTVSYDYRTTVYAANNVEQSGSNGTLTYGTPSTFSSPTAAFNAYDVGHAITIANSSISMSQTNNGTYRIASVVNATTVTLVSDHPVKATADSNNGSLVWTEISLGTLDVDSPEALIYETAFWAPDVLVDRYHLYNTFGYLINRFENSSEDYRALIRGIFQLFMLGPTLERFESAVNTVAGIPVVRDDGEILLRYTSNALQQGTDGYPSGTTGTFTAASAVFTAADVSSYIYIVDGVNNNRLYKISAVLSSTQVQLLEFPSSDGPVSWELTSSTTHNILTSKNTYAFSRTIPLRADITLPGNAGLIILNAFEVLSTVFTVTDYVESPQWWTHAQIPEELWPTEDASRRQSTPSLVENIIGPGDDGRIGDPGFLIGADSIGFTPPASIKYTAPTSDGVLEGDYAYPFSNNVYFHSTVNGLFTAADIGNILVIGGTRRFRIIEQLTAYRVKLEVFERVYNESTLAWRVDTQPIVLRNKAAFVVLDTWLKYHLFYISFDPSFLGQVSPTLISDLNELVFVAKPTYTYLILSPSSLFKEIIKATEFLSYSPYLTPGGDEGEIMSANASPLVIGSGWRIGNWFRYISNTGTFTAPAASIANVLGVPTAGYAHYISKFVPDSADFTASNVPIPADALVEVLVGAAGINAVVQYVDLSTYTITVPTATFTDLHVGAMIRIYKLGSPYNGDFVIGRIISSTVVVASLPYAIGIQPQGSWPVVGDNALTWQIVTTGTSLGYIRNSANGECLFTDVLGLHHFSPSHVGTYIHYTFTAYLTNQSFRITRVDAVDVPDCTLAALSRFHPIELDPDETGSVTGNTLTATSALFVAQMCRVNRAGLNAATELTEQYFIVFTTGANSGQRRRLETYISGTQVIIAGAVLTTDLAVDYFIEKEVAPTVVTETSTWEHLKNSIVIDGNTIDLSATPTQDVDPTVSFTAYGVREPIDPSLETFDATLGDTYYMIGMPDPRPTQGRSRTGHDTDLREDPLQITRT